jgi:hypothetical protein
VASSSDAEYPQAKQRIIIAHYHVSSGKQISRNKGRAMYIRKYTYNSKALA